MADRQNLSSKGSGINRPVFDILRVLAAAMVFMIHFAGFRNLPKPSLYLIYSGILISAYAFSL